LDTSSDQTAALSVVDSDSPSETPEGSSHTEAVMQHDNSYKAISAQLSGNLSWKSQGQQ